MRHGFIKRSRRWAGIFLRCAVMTAAVLFHAAAWGQDVSAPAILQWFEASYRTIERRTGDAFLTGYGALWTPPPGRADSGNQSVGYDVYDRFDLGRPGNPTLYGTETGLRSVVKTVHRAGLDIYADYIINHSGFSNLGTPGFANAGGYPGLLITHPQAIDGDYHTAFPAQGPNYEYQFRLSGLVDIDQRTNFQYIRSPVPGFANNIPPGTTPAFGRLANVPDENNRRFYPDRSLQPIMVFDPQTGEQNIAIHPFNNANPMAGDPVAENALGYLMRYAQWMVQDIGVDGFRVDAARHVYPFTFDYFDRAVYRSSPRRNLDGSRRDVFSFLEAYTGDKNQLQSLTRKNINPNDPGRVGGNRDVLDFPLFFALRDNLTNNGTGNNWHNIRHGSQDSRDDGDANNGSQAVAFAGSHDDGFPYLNNVANAFVLMRPGNATVYHNAHEFGTNRDFPKDGRGDALGGIFGDTITTLVELRNTHGRGDFRERWVDDAFNPNGFSNIYVYERENSALVGLNSRLDGGYDQRNGVQTAFAPGTHLIELSGNATSSSVDPFDDIPDVITVGGDGKVSLRIPRNRNPNGQEHGRGYVIYGVAAPQGKLSLSNVAKTIAPETPTSSTNGVSRLSPIDVITANSFQVELRTNAVNLLGNPAYRDHDADGDNALLRLDEGLDLNGNGQVDYRTPGPTSYAFEDFLTLRQPGYAQPNGNGLYRQEIDTTQLAEGYHYLTARAYRHRNAGEPPVFSDFKKVLYVDRQKPQSAIESFLPIQPANHANRDLVIRSLDGTAYKMTAQELTGAGAANSGVHVFLDLPAAWTDNQVRSAVSSNSQAGQHDRDLWKYGFFGLKHGNHVATVVTYEISGNVNVQRFPGLFTQTSNGRGLGDINFDGQFSPPDIAGAGGAFEQVLYSQNQTFNPAADIDGNGRINTTDLVRLGPTLSAAGASPITIDAVQGVRFRRVNFSGDQVLSDADRDILRGNIGMDAGPDLWRFDLDESGVVTAADETLFLTRFNPAGAITVQPGADIHITSALDAATLILPTGGTRVTIDPGVGTVVLNDLRFDWSFYEPPSSSHVVPEPSALALAVCALAVVIMQEHRRRKRRNRLGRPYS
jgi:glycosidase